MTVECDHRRQHPGGVSGDHAVDAAQPGHRGQALRRYARAIRWRSTLLRRDRLRLPQVRQAQPVPRRCGAAGVRRRRGRRTWRAHPKAAVVALAEGLQTSFWRLDAAGLADDVTWYSIDLPPVIALRETLLPHDDRIVNIAQSALDRSWMDQVDATDGVFITAEGLFMYLDPDGGALADRRLRGTVPRRAADVRLDPAVPEPARRSRAGNCPTATDPADAVRYQRRRRGGAGRSDSGRARGPRRSALSGTRDLPSSGRQTDELSRGAAPFPTQHDAARLRLAERRPRHKVDLTGVSETALLTLQVRASEARRPDGRHRRPDGGRSWSTPSTSTSPSSATPGARTWRCARWPSTACTAATCATHPTATVVALAEGLQTSFYRLDAVRRRPPIPLAHCRSAADDRTARASCCRRPTG